MGTPVTTTGWALRAVRAGQYVLMQHTPSGMWTDIATCDNLGNARLVLQLVIAGEVVSSETTGPRNLIGPGHAGYDGRQT